MEYTFGILIAGRMEEVAEVLFPVQQCPALVLAADWMDLNLGRGILGDQNDIMRTWLYGGGKRVLAFPPLPPLL